MRYKIVIERMGEHYTAHVPELSGCVAVGPTLEAVRSAIHAAIDCHVARLTADGAAIPAPMAIRSMSDDPFAAFIEWSGEADEAAYADL